MPKRTVKERLLLSLSAILAAAVSPFAYLRLRDEEWSVAILDISIVCLMLVIFVYVFLSRNTRTPGIVMALVFIGAALTTMQLLGPGQIFWVYPAMTAAFFMLDTRHAVLLAAVSFCSVLAMLWESYTLVQLATTSVTLLITVLFALSFAVTTRQQQGQLEHLANVDPLTGAGNRRAQNESLDRVNAIFRRNQSPASVLLMDVDHFKKINDRHGHVTGDQILVEIADLVCGNIRPTENLYRYGGEEFVIVAEQTPLPEAEQLAEKLRQLIEGHEFVAGINTTVSVGVAELARGEGRQGWLGRADSALFQAKTAGRNRVVPAAPPSRPALAAVPGGARGQS